MARKEGKDGRNKRRLNERRVKRWRKEGRTGGGKEGMEDRYGIWKGRMERGKDGRKKRRMVGKEGRK